MDPIGPWGPFQHCVPEPTRSLCLRVGETDPGGAGHAGAAGQEQTYLGTQSCPWGFRLPACPFPRYHLQDRWG